MKYFFFAQELLFSSTCNPGTPWSPWLPRTSLPLHLPISLTLAGPNFKGLLPNQDQLFQGLSVSNDPSQIRINYFQAQVWVPVLAPPLLVSCNMDFKVRQNQNGSNCFSQCERLKCKKGTFVLNCTYCASLYCMLWRVFNCPWNLMILRCAGRGLAPTPISEQSGAHYVPRQLQKLSLGYLLHPK